MRITIKGSPTSGWYAPPKGTHSGDKHRSVGSGKATASGKPVAKPSKKRVSEYTAGTAGEYLYTGGMYCHPLSDFMSVGLEDEWWEDALEDERAVIKAAVANELAERTGITPEDAAEYVTQWARTSNGGEIKSLAIQKDAAEEMGVKMGDWQQKMYDEALASGKTPILPSDKQRALTRAMYDYTQEELAKQGYGPNDTIRLYRGVAFPSGDSDAWRPGDIINYNGNALESWSIDKQIAETFASEVYWNRNLGTTSSPLVVEMVVPVRNIVGTARTGFGCITEGEVVALGTLPGQQVRIMGKIMLNGKNAEYDKGEIVLYDPKEDISTLDWMED